MMTAPISRSSSASTSSWSRAPGPQARTHSMHSEQMAQLRQRLASATACSGEKPVLTSSQVSLRAAPGELRHGHTRHDLGLAQDLLVGFGFGLELVPQGRSSSPRRWLWMARAPRRPAAIASMAVQGPTAAASPPANTPLRPVAPVCLSTTIWLFSILMLRAPLVKSSIIAWPVAKMTVSHSSSVNELSIGTGGRQPRSSASPSVQYWKSTLLARPSASELIEVGMQEQMKVIDSPRPSSISSLEAGMVSSSSMQVRVTFSAPKRSAVRPASKATSPPPTTTTFLPMSTGLPTVAS